MSAMITAFPRVRPATRRLRITRRGRVVVTVLVGLPLLGALAGVALNGGGASASNSPTSVHFSHVTVAPGESLWQVAEDVSPNSDPRDVIADIQSLNGLASTSVQAGQTLAIPTKYDH